MNTKGIIIIVAIIIIIVGGILFLGNDSSAPVDTSTDEDTGAITSTVPANSISPTMQNEGAVAKVNFVTLGEAGYVVVHRATEDDTPGNVIGNSEFLPEGSSQDITITLSEDIADGDVLFFMLHRDDGNGIYEFPGPDTPITTTAGEPITTRVVVGEEGGLMVVETETEVVEPDEVTEESENETGVEEEGQENIVAYTDTGFSPETIEIESGETVRWVNNSSRNLWVASMVHPTHTLYPGKAASDCLGSSFDTCTSITPGGSWEFTFNESGSWQYHNHLSTNRRGTVDVN